MKSLVQVSLLITTSLFFSSISNANISFDFVEKNSNSRLSFSSSEALTKLQFPQIEVESIAIHSISDKPHSFLEFLYNNRQSFEGINKIEFIDQAFGFGSEFKEWLLPHLEKSFVVFIEKANSSVISLEFEAPPSPESIPGSASPEMALSTSSAALQARFSGWMEKFIEESHASHPELTEAVREDVALPKSVLYLAKLPMEGQKMMQWVMKCFTKRGSLDPNAFGACKTQIETGHYRSRANGTCIRLGYDRAATFTHRPVTQADLGVSVEVQRKWYRDMREGARKALVANSEGFASVTEFYTKETVQKRRRWARTADDQYLHESHEIFDSLICEAEKENLERNRAALHWENFANSGAIEDFPLFNRKTPTKYVDPMIKRIFPGVLKDSP